MKLFNKIFLCFMLVFSAAFQVSGYLLLTYSYENSIEQEKKYALNQFWYNKYIIQSALYTNPQLFEQKGVQLSSILKNLNPQVAFYDEEKELMYSGLSIQPDDKVFHNAADGTISYLIEKQGTDSRIFACGQISQSGTSVYLVTETDISLIVSNQRLLTEYFQKLYLMIMGLGFILILVLTHFLVRPINRVSRAAKIITAGNYSERITVVGSDEIGELAENFNQMAETIEEKIDELSDTARQKEDFVGNFAHELKTPLTSVIGYADMLYQKDMSREQVKEAAEYIMNEGMRLESLSLKLMDLIILGKQDFRLEVMPVEEIFENVALGLEPICSSKKVHFHLKADSSFIKVEYDLFKTMLLNFIDNAIKADCKDIWLLGKKKGPVYSIYVVDNGKGIPPAELGRIKEAFYMVDKSRSRKQHGAGLGLALADKIAEIHKVKLRIYSNGKKGTTVRLNFICQGGQANE